MNEAGELALLAAIFTQARKDLAPSMPTHIRESSARFWVGAHGDLQTLCDLAGLDMAQVQARILAQHPWIAQPRQLARFAS